MSVTRLDSIIDVYAEVTVHERAEGHRGQGREQHVPATDDRGRDDRLRLEVDPEGQREPQEVVGHARGERVRDEQVEGPHQLRVTGGGKSALPLRRSLTVGKISSYSSRMARRKPGSLVGHRTRDPRCRALAASVRGGHVHGFGLAQRLRERSDARSLTGHGTLYKALGRLEELGLLRSRWEEPAAEGRPRRRLYELTVEGAYVAGQARVGAVGGTGGHRGPNTAGRAAPEPA